LLLLAFLPRRRKTLTFTETGLPAKTEWSITVDRVVVSSTTARIEVPVSKGTHDYTVKRVAGYSTSHSSGTVTVGKDPAEVKVTFNI